VDAAALRDEFPVLRRIAYLNAGTDGPLPVRARDAAMAELERELADGRAHAHFERRRELSSALRDAYATVLGCASEDVALTTCTTEGLAIVLDGLGLGRGDEILTSDEEHPGLLGALQVARDVHGVRVRLAPFDELANAVTPATTVVACSHVNWTRGAVAPAELAQLDVPVILDGAQGAGAVPVDLDALGCDAYAAAGQKWLCGPDGTGLLYVSAALRERLAVTRRGYANLADGGAGLDATLHPDGRRFDTASLSAETVATAGAAVALLAEFGWTRVHQRAAALAAQLAEGLAAAGRTVPRRDATTLVSFSSADPDGERERLAEAGIVLRTLPGGQWLRASVGAWNDDGDLERLLAALDR
jgi:selenocysteine lyase/cysteine desulfurase